MIKKSQLGLYWGQDSFCLVESNLRRPVNIIHAPFNTPLETDPGQEIPEGLKLSSIIQKTLSEQKIASKKVNLSLPVKDLIFRSFVIPWMHPDEVRNVVDFEATKYIPIPLNNLSYAYHPVMFTEAGQKNFRILFVAIRKDILERYTGILEHTGLQIDHIEPASVSLVRLLQKKGHISRAHAGAIIEIGKIAGKIIVVENQIVQFVREFQLPEDQTDTSTFITKLFNDIRVSFNFYSRQNPTGRIDRIFVLSIQNLTELSKRLSEEFNTPVKSITVSQVLKSDHIEDIGLLCAYGIALKDKAFSTKNFALSEKATHRQRTGTTDFTEVSSYKMLGLVIAACSLIIFLTVILSNNMVVGYWNRMTELNSKQGLFASSETEQIEKMKTDKVNKLISYKDIRIQSNISSHLAKIPQMLPEGTWLKSFQIDFYISTLKETSPPRKISRISIVIDGYAYRRNSNEQFRTVNILVSRFKNEENFSSSFDSIDLVTVNQVNWNNFPVTYFRIVCK